MILAVLVQIAKPSVQAGTILKIEVREAWVRKSSNPRPLRLFVA